MKILVTGGAGYIGLHTCVTLISQGYEVVIIDDFSTSEKSSISKLEKIVKKDVLCYEVDVKDSLKIEKIFEQHSFDAVIHFAGFKSVNESINEPLKYYINNVGSTISLINTCIKFGVKKIVFSSSASVYGDNISPIKENVRLSPTTNPYAETKVICERILSDVSNIDSDFKIIILRYFNPVGAHESGLIGDKPKGIPDNIMPYISQVAAGKLDKLFIYGDNYPTYDGTAVRDFIHVMDLAEGHVAALNHLEKGVQYFNLGTGTGISILKLVKTFMEVNNVSIPYTITGRRLGDLAIVFADVTEAAKKLNWRSKRTIEDICKDSWNFELKN